MRGDAGLTARLLLRTSGLAGVVVAVGGSVALAGALRPWHAVVADVAMLEEASRATLPSTAGPDVWQAWISVVLAAAVIVMGVLLAVDRAPARARVATFAGAGALAALAASALLRIPAAAVVAPGRASELLAVADALPIGIELEVLAVATVGPWLVIAGAAVAVLGTTWTDRH